MPSLGEGLTKREVESLIDISRIFRYLESYKGLHDKGFRNEIGFILSVLHTVN